LRHSFIFWLYGIGLVCTAACAPPAPSAQSPSAQATSTQPATQVHFVEPLAEGPRALLHAQRGAGPAFAIRQDGPLLSAVNARHGLRAAFDRAAVQLSVGQSAAPLTVQLSGIGRGAAFAPIAAMAPTLHKGAAWYRRSDVSSWYRNGPLGLQQGFVVHHPPAGDPASPLSLRVAIGGAYHATAHGDGVRLEGETPLAYERLYAWDAHGQPLKAEMEVQAGAIVLRINAQAARYPVTVDPLVAIEHVKLVANDAVAFDRFGSASAINGNVALVGAHQHGSVYVFERAEGEWIQTAKLQADDAPGAGLFGRSVAVSETTAVVGAPFALGSQGAVYVFDRDENGVWSQVTRLTADDGVGWTAAGGNGDTFGQAVAISGNTIAAGAPRNRNEGIRSGSAYLFERGEGNVWVQTAKLHALEPILDENFGTAVALDGQAVLVGAHTYNHSNHLQQTGCAYVFERQDAAGWLQVEQLIPNDRARHDHFGQSVSIDAGTALIGAPDSDNGAQGTGSAYIFERLADGSWIQTAELLAHDRSEQDQFGASVSIQGDLAAVGALNGEDRFSGRWDTGSVYLYEHSAQEGWTQSTQITADDAIAFDYFGTSVAIDEDTVIIGAPGDDRPGRDAGSAYILRVDAQLDTDEDTIPDMDDNCPNTPNVDQANSDDDAQGDACDDDDDNDGRPDAEDPEPENPRICGDLDADTCDDCAVGLADINADGPDFDQDGACDAGDDDDDNDGRPDAQDTDNANPRICGDLDADTCDDCAVGIADVAADGPDFDEDGACDTGDEDDDNDGRPDAEDPEPANPRICGDLDADTCDDCAVGLADINADGPDFDEDGACDAGDDDDDNDGRPDAQDPDSANPRICGDLDADGCDDCAIGLADVSADGPDFDEDGACDAGDDDDDNDGRPDAQDADSTNPRICGDLDADTCDDCAIGFADISADGPDFDEDGACDAGDDDDDNDGRPDALAGC
jgi:hypothetical protein